VPLGEERARGGEQPLVLLGREIGFGHGDAGAVERPALDASEVLHRFPWHSCEPGGVEALFG
jgi:hypothetical protein